MRISGGAVSIADVTDRTSRDLGFVRKFWLNEIRAGRAFALGTSLVGGVGNISHVQLLNPAASGVICLVHLAEGVLNATDVIEVAQHNTALTTDVGAGINLLSGGAAGACHVRTEANAVAQGTLIKTYGALSESPLIVAREWFFELGAGEGMLLRNQATNMRLYTNFEWIEL